MSKFTTSYWRSFRALAGVSLNSNWLRICFGRIIRSIMSSPFSTKKSSSSTWKRYVSLELVVSFLFPSLGTKYIKFHEADTSHGLGLRAFFSFLWPKFQAKFSVILGNIENHKLLIDRQITLAYIQDAFAARDKALAEYDKIRASQEQQQLESLERFLNPPLYDEELEALKEKHCPNTGQWLFKDLKYQRWEHENRLDLAHRILWISGIPGAGKSHWYAVKICLIDFLQEKPINVPLSLSTLGFFMVN
jgi:hypothetical protein